MSAPDVHFVDLNSILKSVHHTSVSEFKLKVKLLRPLMLVKQNSNCHPLR